MIPNDYYNATDVITPIFSLNDDQRQLNKWFDENPVYLTTILKKRGRGISTFLALYALKLARPPRPDTQRPLQSFIVVPNKEMMRHMNKLLSQFSPAYHPANNNFGIRVVSGFNQSSILGRTLTETIVIIDEVPFDENDEISEFLGILSAHFPEKIIITASIPKSYEVLFPALKYKGFMTI